MDLSRLKKRASFPFETIATAVAFSPRLESILAESKRVSVLFNANLVLIHIGEKTSEKEETLDKLIEKIGFDKSKYRVIWMDGDPVDTILKLCKTRGECNYWESKFILERDAILDNKYYNESIQCRIHSSHVKHLLF